MKGRAGERQTADDMPGRSIDSKQQAALRRALGQMMQNFGDLTGKVPDALSQADIAMDQAGPGARAQGRQGSRRGAAARHRGAAEGRAADEPADGRRSSGYLGPAGRW